MQEGKGMKEGRTQEMTDSKKEGAEEEICIKKEARREGQIDESRSFAFFNVPLTGMFCRGCKYYAQPRLDRIEIFFKF